jgi:hypothetical protein
MEGTMGIIINEKYKDVVARAASIDVLPFQRAVYVLEEMENAKTDDGEMVFDDYTTIAKAVIEAYVGKEIEI